MINLNILNIVFKGSFKILKMGYDVGHDIQPIRCNWGKCVRKHSGYVESVPGSG